MKFYDGPGPDYSRSKKYAVHTGSESLVQQHQKDECDINVIMRRFGATGAVPAGVAGAVYGDFSSILEFEDALELVERAQAGFMTLPAEIRQRFENNPANLVRYVQSVGPEEFERSFYQADKPGSVDKPLGGSSSAATGEAVVSVGKGA